MVNFAKKTVVVLASIMIGIILAKSTVVSKIAENLKENFCEGKVREQKREENIVYFK